MGTIDLFGHLIEFAIVITYILLVQRHSIWDKVDCKVQRPGYEGNATGAQGGIRGDPKDQRPMSSVDFWQIMYECGQPFEQMWRP